ncbi:MAG: outer membrane beta-barrel protein [Acidiferrobacter sp.]
MVRRRVLFATGGQSAVLLMLTVAVAHGFSVAGLYVGAGGGLARNNHFDSSPPGFPFASQHRGHVAWKAYAGYAFNRYFAIQAGYQHLGQATVATPIGNESVGNRGYDFNGLLGLPLTRRVGLFIEGGAARFRTQTTTPVSTNTVTTGFHPDYGAGVQVYLAHHIALRGEWQDFQIPNNRTQLYGGSLLFRF